ncbi:hypothetical protein CDAR_614271 [Caerostris darwini]|uniref:Uncharacterized protein n=1 Tax=Caerostris darwini TaxID=1538125 RepID=A0AAV4MC89_9ARAC|nr:hypothetical protein CDAR_614271 [Caerostris darwini]
MTRENIHYKPSISHVQKTSETQKLHYLHLLSFVHVVSLQIAGGGSQASLNSGEMPKSTSERKRGEKRALTITAITTSLFALKLEERKKRRGDRSIDFPPNISL